MQAHALLALFALSVGASPIRTAPIDLQARDSSCTLGQIYCQGQTQWGMCGPSGITYGAVSAGTICVDGQLIVGGDGSAASAAPVASAAPSAAPSAVASSAVASSAAAPSMAASSAVVSSAAAPSAPATSAAAASASVPVISTPNASTAAASTAPATPAYSAPAASAPAASASSAAAPTSTSSTSSSGSGSSTGGQYKMYKGDGSTGAGWPSMDDWLSFDKLWDAFQGDLKTSCTQFEVENNSDQEISDMKSAIQSVSQSNSIDPRAVLAMIMQESSGCVRVWTTSYSVQNPGILQTHEGTGSCNTGLSTGGPPAAPGTISTPCPSTQIEQMLKDGVAGTASGDGIKALVAGGTDAQAYYKASRKYNSGSIAADGDLSSPSSVATKCYTSDIANKLLGVTGKSGCTLT